MGSLLGTVVALASFIALRAAGPLQHIWSFHVAGGSSVDILSSSESRDILLAGIQFATPVRRLRVGGHEGQAFQELFYEHENGIKNSQTSLHLPLHFDGVGYLFGARYQWGLGAYRIYGDLGAGIFYDFRASQDLPGRFNYTPFLDVGLIIPNGSNPLTVGLRLMHISNGGQVSPNPGQNELMLDLGIQF